MFSNDPLRMPLCTWFLKKRSDMISFSKTWLYFLSFLKTSWLLSLSIKYWHNVVSTRVIWSENDDNNKNLWAIAKISRSVWTSAHPHQCHRCPFGISDVSRLRRRHWAESAKLMRRLRCVLFFFIDRTRCTAVFLFFFSEMSIFFFLKYTTIYNVCIEVYLWDSEFLKMHIVDWNIYFMWPMAKKKKK